MTALDLHASRPRNSQMFLNVEQKQQIAYHDPIYMTWKTVVVANPGGP